MKGSVRSKRLDPRVTELQRGDFVVATVRRPGKSVYDAIGTSDMTTDDVYYERGINLRHGYLTEYYVDERRVRRQNPRGSATTSACCSSRSTVAEKGITQAYEIQRRLRVWRPEARGRDGRGTIGLLAALVLRLQRARRHRLRPAVRSRISIPICSRQLGARYLSTTHDAASLDAARSSTGHSIIIFEATGFSPIVFDSMQALAKNGVLVLSSVTGGDRTLEVPVGPDQPRVRAGQQGDGRHRQRQP